MTDVRLNQILQAQQKFQTAVKNTLDIPITPGSSQHDSELDGFSNFNFKIAEKMTDLKGTKYYCTETKLLHFTSLEVLFSIISESAIRMYNLWNSSDPNEYILAGKIFDQINTLNGKNIEHETNKTKSFSFITSFTDASNYNSPFHWKNYGNNYQGVAIEFELNPEYESWYKFILSKTFYNDLKDFDQLSIAREKFQHTTGKVSNSTFDILMPWLLSLYKETAYQDEKETRLYLYSDGHKGTFPGHFKKYTYSAPKTANAELNIQYFKLPLCNAKWEFVNPMYNKNEIEFWKRIPKLRISRIYFGPDFRVKNWKRFCSQISKYISEKTEQHMKSEHLKRVSMKLSSRL